MGLNLDWVKRYGLRCRLRPRASSANSQKIATDKWSFLDHIWTFFANYMFVFYVFLFFVITFVPIKIQTCSAPQNDRPNLSFVKDKRVVGQTWPDLVQKWLFISCYFLGARRTCMGPQATSEAIIFDPIKI